MARTVATVTTTGAGIHAGPGPVPRLALALITSSLLHGLVFYFMAHGNYYPGIKLQKERSPYLTVSLLPPRTQVTLHDHPMPDLLSLLPADSIEHTQDDATSSPFGDPVSNEDSSPRSLLPADYLPAELLTTRPQVQVHVELDPDTLKTHREGGKIQATLWINARGGVDKVSIESSDLPEIYRQVVINGFMAAEFSPGLLNSKAVASRLRVEVVYDYIPRAPKRVAPIPKEEGVEIDSSHEESPPPLSNDPSMR